MKKTLSRTAQVASAIRKDLREAYPGAKFSVKAEHIDCVNIRWEDYVSQKTIEDFTRKYELGHYDGMNDIYEYNNRRDDIPQVMYVFAYRSITVEFARKMLEYLRSLNYEGFPTDTEVEEILQYDNTKTWDVTGEKMYKQSYVYNMIRRMSSYFTYANGEIKQIDPREHVSPYHSSNAVCKGESNVR